MNRLVFEALLVPFARWSGVPRPWRFPEHAPALVEALQRTWRDRHRELSRSLANAPEVFPHWDKFAADLDSCPPAGFASPAPDPGPPCLMAGCPWCAARAAVLTYQGVMDAFFPRRPGGHLWLRELSCVVPGFRDGDGEGAHGLVEANRDRGRSAGSMPRQADCQALRVLCEERFGLFERVSPVYIRATDEWAFRCRQILLLPPGRTPPPPPGPLKERLSVGPCLKPSPRVVRRAVAWAHRYNPQFLDGPTTPLLDLGTARANGGFQKTYGLFLRKSDRPCVPTPEPPAPTPARDETGHSSFHGNVLPSLIRPANSRRGAPTAPEPRGRGAADEPPASPAPRKQGRSRKDRPRDGSSSLPPSP